MNTRVTNHTHSLSPAGAVADVFQQVDVDHATAKTLATLLVLLPPVVKVVHLSANAAIRYTEQTLDGTPVAPTATVGHQLAANGHIFMSANRARACKFIAEGGGAAKLNVTKLVE